MNRLVREIGGEGQTTGYAYDANGNRISTTDPNGNPTRFAFDALNRLIETTDPLDGRTAVSGSGAPSSPYPALLESPRASDRGAGGS